MKKMHMARIAGLLSLAICMITLTGCGPSTGRVLIVQLEESKDDSYGMELFQKALKEGGQVAITVDELRDSDSKFESKYAISKNGSYFIQGAVINYIADRGWSFHSRDFGGLLFKKDQ